MMLVILFVFGSYVIIGCIVHLIVIITGEFILVSLKELVMWNKNLAWSEETWILSLQKNILATIFSRIFAECFHGHVRWNLK